MNWLGLGNSFQLFMAYAVLTMIVTTIVVRRARSGWPKWAAAIVSLAIFYGLTRIDNILGAREHRRLCEQYAGVKIYKQVILPAEFYYPDGRPKFIEANGQIYAPALANFVKFGGKNQDSYSVRYLKIDKTINAIIDARTGELLAEHISFRRWPSPFVPSILHGGAVGCENSAQEVYELDRKFHQHVFPRLTISKGTS